MNQFASRQEKDSGKKKLPQTEKLTPATEGEDKEEKTRPELPDRGRFGFSGETADYDNE